MAHVPIPLGFLAGADRHPADRGKRARGRAGYRHAAAETPAAPRQPGRSEHTGQGSVRTEAAPREHGGALDRLRAFEAADLPQSEGEALDFAENVDRSLLPEFIRVAERAGIRLGFIRVQRRPGPDGPPVQSDELQRYVHDLRSYLEARGVYYGDDYGDPLLSLDRYADGDHLRPDARIPYTENCAKQHARFFQ